MSRFTPEEPLGVFISGPPGVGKSTVAHALPGIGRVPWAEKIISTTSRRRREAEIGGVDYHFVSPSLFEHMARRGCFLAETENRGHAYGFQRRDILGSKEARAHALVFVVDLGGMLELRNEFLHFVSILLLPGSPEELEARLEERGEPQAEEMARLSYEGWKDAQGDYDYVVTGDRAHTLRLVSGIVWAKSAESHAGAAWEETPDE